MRWPKPMRVLFQKHPHYLQSILLYVVRNTNTNKTNSNHFGVHEMQICSLRIKWSLKIVELKSKTWNKRKTDLFNCSISSQTIGEHLLLLIVVLFHWFLKFVFFAHSKKKIKRLQCNVHSTHVKAIQKPNQTDE